MSPIRPRPHRSPGIAWLPWLLWLLMALMPLRGGAHVGLMLNTAAHPDRVVLAGTSSDAPADRAADRPCHETAHAGSTGSATAEATPDAAGHCGTCDACHASLAPAPADALSWDALPTAAPTPAPGTGLPPGVVRGLYRPPRALHA
jgi:hypothetical protein